MQYHDKEVDSITWHYAGSLQMPWTFGGVAELKGDCIRGLGMTDQ